MMRVQFLNQHVFLPLSIRSSPSSVVGGQEVVCPFHKSGPWSRARKGRPLPHSCS